MAVDVVMEDKRWREAGLERLARQAIEATLRHLDLDPDAWEVAVLGCDDRRIAALNGDFRDRASPTNVLSWPSEERSAGKAGAHPRPPSSEPELGDIAIAFDTCQREAAEQAKPPEQHILHLLVHAALHLLGYDHQRAGDGDLMESLETAILCKLGVPNPY